MYCSRVERYFCHNATGETCVCYSKGLKLRVMGDEEYIAVPMDYEVPTNYKFGELFASTFLKKGKQAHELVTKILLPKIGSTGSCSKFERFFMYAIK